MAKKTDTVDTTTGEIVSESDTPKESIFKPVRPKAQDVAFGDVVPTQLEQFDELSFDEIAALTTLTVGDVEDIVVIEKEALIARPFIILDWAYRSGTFGMFVAVRIKTQDNRNAVFIDGGSGILEQLQRYHAKLVRKGMLEAFHKGGLFVPYGLKVSRYTYRQDDGTEIPAQTYYLDTSS